MPVITLGPSPNQIRLKWAILEITAQCNLRCVHCSRDAGSSKQPGEMNTEQWLDLTSKLHAYGVDMLLLGGGEPLLKKARVRAIVEQAAALGKPTRINTNGLLFDEELAVFLAANGGSVTFGMDGLDPQAYERFRGRKGTYERLRRSIELGLKHGILDALAVTATKVNLDQVPKMIDFCAEIGVRCTVCKYVPTGRPNFRQLLPDPVERREVLELVGKKRLQHPHIQIVATREPLEALVFGSGAMNMPGCIAGIGWCLITAKGEVFPCPCLPLTLGNVLESAFAEIWERSPELKALRGRASLQGKCGHCPERKNCGGCRALAYALTGDHLGADPQCWMYEPRGAAGAPQAQSVG